MVSLGQANSSNICMSPSASANNRVRYFTYDLGAEQDAGRPAQEDAGQWKKQCIISTIGCLFSSKTFANDQKGLIFLGMDNISAVTYIHKKGGTHSTQFFNLGWCLQRQLAIQAEHLPGSLSLVADSESRTMKDWCNWMINPKIFQQIRQSLGPLQMDLFVSRLAKRLPGYYSWRSEAEATESFNKNWAQARDSLTPPWCLISRCLNQIKQRVLLVIPLWLYQPWFSIILINFLTPRLT